VPASISLIASPSSPLFNTFRFFTLLFLILEDRQKVSSLVPLVKSFFTLTLSLDLEIWTESRDSQCSEDGRVRFSGTAKKKEQRTEETESEET